MTPRDDVERIARDTLTEKELEAWLPYHRGMSQRAIGAWLNIDRSVVRDRIERAKGKLAKAEVGT